MDHSKDDNYDKRHLEDSIDDLENAVNNNLEPAVEEQSQDLETDEESSYVRDTASGVRDKASGVTGGLNLRERFSRETSKDEDFGDLDKETSRRRALGTIAGGLAVLGLGAGAYTVLADDNYDVVISDNDAVSDLADEYAFSRNDSLASIGADMQSVMENNPDRDYEVGLRDTLRDNEIHLTADNIMQREYDGLDAVTYSQAESKAREILSEYEE